MMSTKKNLKAQKKHKKILKKQEQKDVFLHHYSSNGIENFIV